MCLRHRDAGAGPVTARAVAKAVEEGVLPRGSAATYALDASAVLYLATTARWSAVHLTREAKARLLRCWRDALASAAPAATADAAVVELDRDLTFDPRPAAALWSAVVEAYAADRERYIETDPERMGGVPILRGTRIPVRSILARYDGGDALEDIAADYPEVPEPALAAAVAYARTHPAPGRPRKRLR